MCEIRNYMTCYYWGKSHVKHELIQQSCVTKLIVIKISFIIIQNEEREKNYIHRSKRFPTDVSYEARIYSVSACLIVKRYSNSFTDWSLSRQWLWLFADTNAEAVCMMTKIQMLIAIGIKDIASYIQISPQFELIAECVLHTIFFLYFIFSYIINN